MRRQVLSDIAERPDIVQGVLQTGNALRDSLDRLRVTKLLGVVHPFGLYDFDGRILHHIEDELMPYGGPLQELAARLATGQPTSPYVWCDRGTRGERILTGVAITFRGNIEGALLTAFSLEEIQGEFSGKLLADGVETPEGWYTHSLSDLPCALPLSPISAQSISSGKNLFKPWF